MSDSSGVVVLEVPTSQEHTGAITFSAYTPDGIRVAQQTEFPGEPWSLPLPPAPAVDPVDPQVAQRERLTGRAIDRAGKPVRAGSPLIILARLEAGGPVLTLAQTVISSGGYFQMDRPMDPVVRAWARVAGIDASVIALDETGRVQRRVIVVTQAAGSREDDCSCDDVAPRSPEPGDLSRFPESFSTDLAGRCVDLTVPNRVLEEVIYQKVVRVTEPDIEGISTAPPRVSAATYQQVETLVAGMAAAKPRDPAGAQKNVVLHADVASRLLAHPDRLSPEALADAAFDSEVTELDAGVRAAARGGAGRIPMDATRAVDWDETPTIYQSVSVSHGHLLQYRQVWRADGYSLGDLLYSLPLAPGQKKLISTLDWTRTEEAVREEWTSEEEELHAFLERDRDVSEIVESHLSESMRGGSSAQTWGGGGGIGGGYIGSGFAVFAGVAGGGGGSSSTSWQDSGRRFAAESMQSVRDTTIQGASAVRSTRSTIVQVDQQTERARAVTEVVVNYNHCHALTIEYFEVLRHFTVTHELADVRECLFVPLPMRWFDRAKALRWREPLARFLRDRSLQEGFAAAERVEANWQGFDTPQRSFAEEAPEELEGELWISFVIPRPRDAADGRFQIDQWRAWRAFLPTAPLELWTSKMNQRVAAERDLIFRQEIAPGIAAGLAGRLRCFYVTASGGMVDIPLDPTLVSRYAEGVPLYVTLRAAGALPNIAREDIVRFGVRIEGVEFPENARVLVHRGKLRYDTAHLRHLLFDEPRILNDLAAGDEVLVPTPLAREETRDPRQEDRDLVSRLLRHLNDHLEYYHQLIWMTMDPARRYLLLDGFQAPNALGRSLASVVENRIIGIVGNCLVMPVSPGNILAPPLRDARGNLVDLMEHYAVPPERPIRITVPTRGVFAEAVQGSCNSCEGIDDTRLWRFDESPIPDTPLPPEPVSLESRAETPADATPTQAPPPIINIQNAPALPDPMGLGNVFSLLSRSNLFTDVTGLAANQEAALGAYQAALDTAKSFAGMASAAVLQQDLSKNIDRTLERAASARDAGNLTPEQASSVAYNALRNLVGDAPKTDEHPLSDPNVGEVVDRAADAASGSVVVDTPGEHIEASFADEDGEVSIGSALVPVTQDFEKWSTLSVWDDNEGGTFLTPLEMTDVAAFEAEFWPADSTEAKDQSWKRAEQLGWLRRKPGAPSLFEVNVRYPFTFPGASAGAKKPAGKNKLPLVVFLHGAHEHFNPASLRIPPSHRGYTAVQEHLATLGFASISIDDNISNWLREYVENRAQMMVAAIRDLQTRTRKGSFKDRIDFEKMILVGHSRGGEAAVRATLILSSISGMKVLGTVAVAPTDFKGPTGDPIARPLEHNDTEFFLGLYGTHDGDVTGEEGTTGFTGNGFRHYGRALCPKAHVFIDLANHNRFNTFWVDPSFNGADEEIIRLSDLPLLLSQPNHAQLLIDYIGALARWKFSADLTGAQLLDGRIANSLAAPVSMLHQFGSPSLKLGIPFIPIPAPGVEVVDSFEDGAKNDVNGSRTIPSGELVEIVDTGATPAIGTHAKPELIAHRTNALFVPLSGAITPATPRLRTDMGLAPLDTLDMSANSVLEFDLAVLGDIGTEASTNAIAAIPPRISVTLIDKSLAGTTTVVVVTNPYTFRAPRSPMYRELVDTRTPAGVETTHPAILFRFETMRIPLAEFAGIDPSRIQAVEISGDSAMTQEFLIDNVRFVKEVV